MAYSINTIQDDCYPNSTVLINKLDIRDEAVLSDAETVAVLLHSSEIEENPPKTAFTFEFYCSLHEVLFGDLYEWAGKLRTVDLSKKGTSFCPAAELQKYGQAKFDYLQSRVEFHDLEHSEFVMEIADFYNDLNMLHCFREGNGRTQRLFFTLLIRRAGYDINFAECDMDELMMATIYAAQGIMDFLITFFDKAIQ